MSSFGVSVCAGEHDLDGFSSGTREARHSVDDILEAFPFLSYADHGMLSTCPG
jgi:hypothetical protein